MIYSDKELSQKLERTEASANADFVETRARLFPASGATWIEVAGAYAMFDGVESPCTQSFGLGMFDEVKPAHLDEIEAFFSERGAPVFHEVSPMADPSLLSLFHERGYHPIELSSVMYRELDPSSSSWSQMNSRVVTRMIDEGESDMWAEISATGWAPEQPDLYDFLLAIGNVTSNTRGGSPFIAELEGRAIAAAGFSIYGDVCIMAGASTIPEARRQGAQNALLAARLNHAVDRGCTLAMMAALPGSQSQKNAQKNGFNIAYTRIKWQLFE